MVRGKWCGREDGGVEEVMIGTVLGEDQSGC